ncbi:hypothetical protein D3OALGA1CA_2440 [Olavius algarvensis associated proteobacterium Delta 3]|nr:hypothetical protein D3OALGA1CA_2440 [Olavius algarvensis associated proteobacterium Delta 3]CAB5155393.1 hypothetical protein D3OALGB2SA_5071 [Olavius algarvensis associated proteobacterium Delta 3]
MVFGSFENANPCLAGVPSGMWSGCHRCILSVLNRHGSGRPAVVFHRPLQ